MNKPQPQTGPEIEEYSTTATPKAYAGSVPVFCAHDAIVPLKDLRPNPKNPNQHPPEQIKLLASIIRATGWRAPITVSKRSGLVTKGHGRLMAAQLDDLTDAPVDYQDYASEAEELADLTADNRIAELATTDNKMLAEVFADIDTGEIPFMLSGYTEEEYGNLVTALSEALHDDESEKEDGDTEPETPPEEPFTEPGDLWLLGDHRLYCGDSLKMGDVQKATDGQRADLVFTDPPYGMGKESDGVQNDNQNQNDLLEFNKKWIALSFSILKENGSWYCWGIDEPLMDIYAFILRPMIAANQITFRNYITWAKHSAFGVNSELMRSYTVIYNQAPTAPSSITVPSEVLGGENLSISWAASTDPDGNLSGYVLERKVGSGTWAQIYKGSSRSYTDAITYGWTSVQYRVKAYDAAGAESAYTTSATRTVTNNRPPVISGTDGALGSFSTAAPSYEYTVTDADGHQVDVVEMLDGVTLRSYTVTLGHTNTLTIGSEAWLKVVNGSHTLKIVATDAKDASVTRTLTFTKAVTSVEFEQTLAMEADAMPTKALVNIQGNFPAGCTLQVWICNNGNDASPTWEDITQKARTGQKHYFTNQTKTAAAWGVKVKAKLLRGSATETCYIQSIGGNFA